MIVLKINEKEIETIQKEDVVRGSKNYFTCRMIFDNFWENFEKTVVFKKVCGNTPFLAYAKDMESDIIIPHELLTESGKFKIGVFGIKDEITLPTLWSEEFTILSGSDTDGNISQPTPTIYEEFISEVKETKEIAQSVRNDANNGKFNGLNGKDGVDGVSVTNATINASGRLILTLSNGLTVDAGIAKGANGIDGKDGYTPQKGVDYFTDEDIAGLNIPSVDKSYSPNSENAQSGKAVAEAVNTFFSDNNMEFIKEITLTEDVGMIDILTKDEGIELRDTFIYCSFLVTEGGYKYISLRKDGGGSYYGYGLNIGNYTENHITNGKPHVFGHFIYPIGETGRVLTLGLEGTPDGDVDLATGFSQGRMMHSSTLSYTYNTGIGYSAKKIDNLNMFLVGSTETNLIKAGSKIWLFGRRVK